LRPVGSIIHDLQIQNKTIWVSFDIEAGGPRCGIIQLSAVFYDHNGAVLGEYDSYCKPPQNAIFLPQACAYHGITSRNDTRLIGAPPVANVWIDFCKPVDAIFVSSDNTDNAGVLVAWNGKACDLEWIYRLIHSHDECEMPTQIQYFMDPYQVIKKHHRCNLNPRKSNLPDLKLSTVYKHISRTELANAHNSLFDCRAQGTVLMSTDFKKYQDMKTSICTIESVWSHKERNRVKLRQELRAPAHDTWKSDDNAESWTLPNGNKFTGPSGGTTPGPTAAVKKVLDGVTHPIAALALMFLFFVDLVMLRTI
jgi:DNA polymerase III epsilon subunit-like protein